METDHQDGNGPRYISEESNLLPRWEKPAAAAFLAVGLAGEAAGHIPGQCRLANRDKYIL